MLLENTREMRINEEVCLRRHSSFCLSRGYAWEQKKRKMLEKGWLFMEGKHEKEIVGLDLRGFHDIYFCNECAQR